MAEPPAPFDQTSYSKLLNLYREFRLAGIPAVRPFVPFVGDLFALKAHPRIMFIGMATDQWNGEPFPKLRDEIAANRKYCLEDLANGGRHPFISFLVRMTQEVWLELGCAEVEQTREWSLQRTAWSNLAKIAVNDKYPVGNHASKQRIMNKSLLKHELDSLRPTIVFITTGSTYEGGDTELVHSIFGSNEKWQKCLPGDQSIQGRVWYNVRQPQRQLVFWTPHPRSWPHRENEISGILSVIRKYADTLWT